MAERAVDHLLIGGGLAAANCARWIREEGGIDAGSVLLVGRENDPPYNRPPLSKKYLGGQEKREEILFRPDEWWEEQKIDLMTRTSVMKLDTEARRAKLSNGDEVIFDKALLATGANVRRLHPGHGELDGIHYLRTIPTSDVIAADASEAERVVMIGGSFISCEVAATLTAKGNKCAIVMLEEVTFERIYGKEVGGFFHRVLEEHGVEIHPSESLAGFEGDGRVTHVVTESGLTLEASCVVIGAGVMPDVTLAKAAGLELGEGGGVKCSSRLETSVPGIYAAGDICEYDSVVHGRPLRIEHWDVAFNQGKTAGLNMLGRDVAHEEIPYFFSDLADWASSEYVGPGEGDVVIRGSMDDGEFTAFYVDPDSGVVTAALTVGRSDDLDHARRFIKEKTAPERAQLADAGTDLGDL